MKALQIGGMRTAAGRRVAAPALALLTAVLLLLALAGAAQAGGGVVWDRSATPPPGTAASWQDLALGADGSASVAGTGMDIIWAARYTYGGSRSWMHVWAPNARDIAYGTGVTVCPAGDTYVCGWEETAGGKGVLLKYSRTGRLVWTRIFQVRAGYPSFPQGVVSDRRGNVYLAGSCQSASGLGSGFVACWNTSGRRMWTTTLDLAGQDTSVEAIVGDGSGATYVAGRARPVGGFAACATTKLSASGRVVWQQSLPSAFESYRPMDIDVRGGLVAVAGYATDASDVEQGFACCYTTGGSIRFSDARWVSPYGSETNFEACCVDSLGRVLLAGDYFTPPLGRAGMEVCLDVAGSLQWQRLLGVSVYGHRVAAGGGGSSYVAGNHGLAVFVTKTAADGGAGWATELAGAGISGSDANGLAVRGTSAVFVAGEVSRAAGGSRARAARLTP